ncbi:MAG: TRAP transporter substrate-binding protein [Synergistetes bacterium]|nr:TRAP transporter substrate-binding protein [Synergistota bacterium]MCX8127586.1 TRAP transporter substrate-binding protein [Synergistota bacterium]MDW8191497.1 TRAP transporter substrate-binding protein [Synergistota bacterium]
MKRSVGLVVMLCLAIVLAYIPGFTVAEAKTITMKFGHYAAPGHPGDRAANMFAENVQKRTNGGIVIAVYPNNQLGDPPQLLEQNIAGVIEMSLPTQGALDKYSKKFAVVMLPFVYRDYSHAHKVLDGPFKEWTSGELEKQGLIFLSNWEWGFRNLTNNVRPINSPDDVKGLKIRTPPEIQLQAAMEALGAVVTKISFAELYMALKQGVVDGQENPIAVIYANKIYEVQKYLALTRHCYNSMVHVMSKKAWDKLTPEQQKIIAEESKKAGDYMRQTLVNEEAGLIEKLKGLGMVITTPDLAPFKAKMGPAYERIAQYAGKENVETFLKMVEKL